MACFPAGASSPEFHVLAGDAVVGPGSVSVTSNGAATSLLHLPHAAEAGGTALSYTLGFHRGGVAALMQFYTGEPEAPTNTAPSIETRRLALTSGDWLVNWQVPGEGSASLHPVGMLASGEMDIELAWDRLAEEWSLTVNGVTETKTTGFAHGHCEGLYFDLGLAGEGAFETTISDLTMTIDEPAAAENCDCGAVITPGDPFSVRGLTIELCGPGPCP